MSALFVKLDATWADHPKLIRAGMDGRGLHATALCLAKRLETDGWIDRVILHRDGATDDLIDRLVDLRLLEADGDKVRPWGWHARNPSQGAIDARRASKSEAGRRGNHKRYKHDGPFEDCPTCNPDPDKRRSSQGAIAEPRTAIAPDRTPSPETETETETETEKTLSLVLEDADRPPAAERFDEFWQLWIDAKRNLDKPAARSSWRTAVKKADPETIIAAARLYTTAGIEPRYMRHPHRWLRAEGWNEPPPESRRAAGEKPGFLTDADRDQPSRVLTKEEFIHGLA